MELEFFEHGEPKDRQAGSAEPESCSVPGDPALIAEGWVRRHLIGPDRVRESIEIYESLGYEVNAQTLAPEDFADQCKECASIICRSYVLIYTRLANPSERGS